MEPVDLSVKTKGNSSKDECTEDSALHVEKTAENEKKNRSQTPPNESSQNAKENKEYINEIVCSKPIKNKHGTDASNKLLNTFEEQRRQFSFYPSPSLDDEHLRHLQRGDSSFPLGLPIPPTLGGLPFAVPFPNAIAFPDFSFSLPSTLVPPLTSKAIAQPLHTSAGNFYRSLAPQKKRPVSPKVEKVAKVTKPLAQKLPLGLASSSDTECLSNITRAISSISSEIDITVVSPKKSSPSLSYLEAPSNVHSVENLSIRKSTNNNYAHCPLPSVQTSSNHQLNEKTTSGHDTSRGSPPTTPPTPSAAAESFKYHIMNNPHLASTLLSTTAERRTMFESLRRKCWSSTTLPLSSASTSSPSSSTNSGISHASPYPPAVPTSSPSNLSISPAGSTAGMGLQTSSTILSHGLDLSFSTGMQKRM